MPIATFQPAPNANSPCDGYVLVNGLDVDFSTIQNAIIADLASASGFEAYALLQAINTTDHFSQLERTILNFDTSTLPPGAIIVSATISLKANIIAFVLGDTTVNICSVVPTSFSDVVVGDYDKNNFGNIDFGNLNLTDLIHGVYNDFSLNVAGITYINPVGITSFGIRLGWDLNDNFTGTWISGGASCASFRMAEDVTFPPILTINYTLPSNNNLLSFT